MRLIDADSLYEMVRQNYHGPCTEDTFFRFFRDIIDSSPTICKAGKFPTFMKYPSGGPIIVNLDKVSMITPGTNYSSNLYFEGEDHITVTASIDDLAHTLMDDKNETD